MNVLSEVFNEHSVNAIKNKRESVDKELKEASEMNDRAVELLDEFDEREAKIVAIAFVFKYKGFTDDQLEKLLQFSIGCSLREFRQLLDRAEAAIHGKEVEEKENPGLADLLNLILNSNRPT